MFLLAWRGPGSPLLGPSINVCGDKRPSPPTSEGRLARRAAPPADEIKPELTQKRLKEEDLHGAERQHDYWIPRSNGLRIVCRSPTE
jgi:hypothetical protein